MRTYVPSLLLLAAACAFLYASTRHAPKPEPRQTTAQYAPWQGHGSPQASEAFRETFRETHRRDRGRQAQARAESDRKAQAELKRHLVRKPARPR